MSFRKILSSGEKLRVVTMPLLKRVTKVSCDLHGNTTACKLPDGTILKPPVGGKLELF